MRTIYIDAENKCHVTNDGTRKAVETDFFDGKCDSFVEGYCYEVKDNSTAIYPLRLSSELDAAQAQYERDLAELEAAYQEGVNSAYD